MTRGVRRASPLAAAHHALSAIATLALALAIFVATPPLDPSIARADDNAEAAALFASGNAHLQSATRLRGERRTRELEAALGDYVASLRIVRSRNVLFNAALALEMLGRREDSFNYLVEYLAVPGLSESERSEATRRLDALRPSVAVLSIASTPPGAEVWIDRRDLAARGRTPLDFALPAGEHRLWLRAEGHRETEARATATTGTTTPVAVELRPEPVSLQVLAPAEPRLSLDGAPIVAGAHVEIPPGAHVVRLEIEGMPPIERRFEVLPGAAPMVIDLAPAAAGLVRRADATLVVASEVAARVLIDGLVVGGGERVEAPVARGEHEIRVEAEGYAPYASRRAFEVGEHAELHVDLVPRGGGELAAPRVIFGVLTGVGALAVAGTLIANRFALDDSDRCRMGAACESLGDTADAWGYAAYAAIGITSALAITELFLLIADDSGGGSSDGEFVLAPVPVEGGGMLVFGGVLAGGRL